MEREEIKYYSTNLKAPEVSFREALLKGLAPDGGLYMPSFIPSLEKDEVEGLSGRAYYDIAYAVLKKFLSEEVEAEKLLSLCRDAYNFEIPIEKVFDGTYILRLDQGPTASFKDFAARMMARLMNYFLSGTKQHYTILAATSGDTGGAVANAFYGLENIDVIILYPLNEVTDVQRKQMTTLQGNVHSIAIDGKFDDCQRYLKRAFSDPALKGFNFSTANSINIGRLLPQAVYYFYVWSRIAGDINRKIVFSVPSGNYGNLMGGVIAREMGLPVQRIVISTNMNNEVPAYLSTGKYEIIDPSLNCISSAMNVGHPSNLARLISLYGGIMDEKGVIHKEPDLEAIRRDFYGISISDEITRKTISEVFEKYNIVLEPHGAVAWKGLELYRRNEPQSNTADWLFVSLETAHPAKFIEEVKSLISELPPEPLSLSDTSDKKESINIVENNYELLRAYLVKLLN